MQKKSFSLIELLTVVTILAVLTGLVMPNVQEYLWESKVSKAKHDLDEIVRAIAIYESQENRDFPGDVNCLLGRYLNQEGVPLDPWGVPYNFSSANEEAGAVVYTSGPDRVSGNQDDIVFSYKPPLAIITAQWDDLNRDGAPSGSYASYPATDSLVVRFNRAVDITTASFTIGSLIFSNSAWGTAAGTPFVTNASASSITPSLGNPKSFSFPFSRSGVFLGLKMGVDTIKVNGTVRDKFGVAAIPGEVSIQAK